MKIKLIKVKQDTHTALYKVGESSETFDDIIRRLLKMPKRTRK